MQKGEYMKKPDITTHKPTDLWVLADDEPLPEGYGYYAINNVRIVFKPHEEVHDDTERTDPGEIVH